MKLLPPMCKKCKKRHPKMTKWEHRRSNKHIRLYKHNFKKAMKKLVISIEGSTYSSRLLAFALRLSIDSCIKLGDALNEAAKNQNKRLSSSS